MDGAAWADALRKRDAGFDGASSTACSQVIRAWQGSQPVQEGLCDLSESCKSAQQSLSPTTVQFQTLKVNCGAEEEIAGRRLLWGLLRAQVMKEIPEEGTSSRANLGIARGDC